MGSGEPDRGQRARWEAEHPDRSAPDGKQSATRGCAPGQKCTRWGVEHPMGSSTPGQNGCNAHRSGVAPSPTSTNEAHCRLPGHEAPLRLVGQSAVRVGRRRAWAIDVDRGACGDDGRPAAHPRAGRIAVRVGRCGRGASTWIAVRVGTMAAPPPTPAPGGSRCVWGDASVGHQRGSWRSLCVSRRPRPCRCRDGCRETRAPGEPGRWPLRR